MADTRKIKHINCDENDTYPLDFWVPANGKFVDPKWFSYSVIQTGTGITDIDIRIVRDGESAPIIVTGADEKMTVDSDQREIPNGIATDIGNGTSSVIKIDKGTAHTSTGFKFNLVIVGDES